MKLTGVEDPIKPPEGGPLNGVWNLERPLLGVENKSESLVVLVGICWPSSSNTLLLVLSQSWIRHRSK